MFAKIKEFTISVLSSVAMFVVSPALSVISVAYLVLLMLIQASENLTKSKRVTLFLERLLLIAAFIAVIMTPLQMILIALLLKALTWILLENVFAPLK